MQRICVMGLGYIGLPTASVLATHGFQVLGVDVNARVVELLNAGRIHIEEPGLHTLVQAAVNSGNLRAALEPEPADVYCIAVPTPLTADKRADMTCVREATEALAAHLQPGNLVILESTSPPGTCRGLVAPILAASGFTPGAQVHLAHCPERVLPGKILKELIENDRIIGGYTPACAEKAKAIYSTFTEGEIILTDATTAEMVKVTENTFRDVNIALANELALLCEELELDFDEVRRLASRHPRVNVHQAGPGVGGHCISVDPWFLVERSPQTARLIAAARCRNDSMPRHVARRVQALLGDAADRPKVAALGVAFKGNVGDTRESPALEVVRLLREAGAEVAVHDPYARFSPVELCTLEECLAGADCLVVLTDHNDYKYLDPRPLARVMRRPVVLDTRHILNVDEWRRAGFQVAVLGVGGR